MRSFGPRMNVSKSEIEHVSKFTIVVNTTETWVLRIVQQIEKQIEVIKAFYHTDDETIFQETALFKIESSLLFDERQIQNIIKTGRRPEIDEMHDKLEPFGIMQFVRSGRIAVTKETMPISELLAEFQVEN